MVAKVHMIKVLFVINGVVQTDDVDGNIATHQYLLDLANSKNAECCYVVANTIKENTIT